MLNNLNKLEVLNIGTCLRALQKSIESMAHSKFLMCKNLYFDNKIKNVNHLSLIIFSYMHNINIVD